MFRDAGAEPLLCVAEDEGIFVCGTVRQGPLNDISMGGSCLTVVMAVI